MSTPTFNIFHSCMISSMRETWWALNGHASKHFQIRTCCLTWLWTFFTMQFMMPSWNCNLTNLMESILYGSLAPGGVNFGSTFKGPCWVDGVTISSMKWVISFQGDLMEAWLVVLVSFCNTTNHDMFLIPLFMTRTVPQRPATKGHEVSLENVRGRERWEASGWEDTSRAGGRNELMMT